MGADGEAAAANVQALYRGKKSRKETAVRQQVVEEKRQIETWVNDMGEDGIAKFKPANGRELPTLKCNLINNSQSSRIVHSVSESCTLQ